jgi:hypothetical protein
LVSRIHSWRVSIAIAILAAVGIGLAAAPPAEEEDDKEDMGLNAASQEGKAT